MSQFDKSKKQTPKYQAKPQTVQAKVVQSKNALPIEEANYLSTDPDFKNSLQNPVIRRIIYAIIFVLGIGVYAQTIPFGYVFDDPIVVTQNSFTKMGIKGIPKMLKTDSFAGIFGEHGGIIAGGRYRPLSIITFAIEWELFAKKNAQGIEQGNPYISHAINILMYALSCVLLFSILAKLFSYNGIYKVNWLAVFQRQRWYLSIPFVATVLFTVHPLHTEVVANIKERDDIMALWGALGSMWLVMKYLETKNFKYLIFSSIVMFLGLMSKENAVTYLAAIPLTTYFFTNKTIKENIASILPMLILTFVYLALRHSILGSAEENHVPNKLMNDPFLEATLAQKYATIVYTLGLYVKLLFFPHPLTVDYYPYQIPIVGWLDLRAIIPFLLYVALGVYSYREYKNRNLIAYGFLFYLATFSLFSNIFFPIGTFMTERFMYMPSIGFCVALAYLVLHFIPQKLNASSVKLSDKSYTTVVTIFFVAVFSLYSLKTMSRNTVWVDDFTLFSTDVVTSANSAKSNHVIGELNLLKGRVEKDPKKRDSLYAVSIKYSAIGVKIHPEYVRCLHNLGAAIFERNPKDYDKAMPYFVRAVQSQPYYMDTHDYLTAILNNPQYPIPLELKIQTLEQIKVYSPDHYDLNSNLGTYYLMQGNIDKAYYYLERSTRIGTEKNRAADYNNLGVIFNRKGDLKTSASWLEKAYQAMPNNPQYVKNLAGTYQGLGDVQKAQQYMQLFQQMTQGK